jgi:hypothetical protein
LQCISFGARKFLSRYDCYDSLIVDKGHYHYQLMDTFRCITCSKPFTAQAIAAHTRWCQQQRANELSQVRAAVQGDSKPRTRARESTDVDNVAPAKRAALVDPEVVEMVPCKWGAECGLLDPRHRERFYHAPPKTLNDVPVFETGLITAYVDFPSNWSSERSVNCHPVLYYMHGTGGKAPVNAVKRFMVCGLFVHVISHY